ncbi:leukemia-associated protein 7 [Amia ocellicauda]|uniref:leukemia-associated protein 7 n=1 Tax=Amia ocellicauda TaxID=2972642 RepID=UPI003464A228
MCSSVLFNVSIAHQIEALALLKQVPLQERLKTDCQGGLERQADVRNMFISKQDCPVKERRAFSGGLGFVSGLDSRKKVRTLAQKAREGTFTRLHEILSQLISVEQDMCGFVSREDGMILHPKDSIELRNICRRMATSPEGCHSDMALKELRDCLKAIVDSLLLSLRICKSLLHTQARGKLTGICGSFPDL